MIDLVERLLQSEYATGNHDLGLAAYEIIRLRVVIEDYDLKYNMAWSEHARAWQNCRNRQGSVWPLSPKQKPAPTAEGGAGQHRKNE